MTEEWKDIPNYEGFYQVSNLGNARSLDRVVERIQNGRKYKRKVKGKTLSLLVDAHGYL